MNQVFQIGVCRYVSPRALRLGLAFFFLGVGIAALQDCGDVGDSRDAPALVSR